MSTVVNDTTMLLPCNRPRNVKLPKQLNVSRYSVHPDEKRGRLRDFSDLSVTKLPTLLSRSPVPFTVRSAAAPLGALHCS
jgi:hypothetical protein